MKVKLCMILLLLGGVALAGCAPAASDHTNQESDGGTHVHGDIREETASSSELPAFLDEKSQEMKNLYTAVALNKDLLEQMPCYCGCGESVGHRNNYDCFIHENKENGAVTWDNHATKCGVCLEIAAQSIVDYQEGKSVKQIRKEIDSTYKKGYAEPTPTPAVS